jgi:hypothetical protein
MSGALEIRFDTREQLLATLLLRPELLVDEPLLEPDDFLPSLPLFTAFSAMRNLEARGEAITVDAVHDYLSSLDAVRGTAYSAKAGRYFLLPLLRCDATPPEARTPERVRAWAVLLRRMRLEREVAALCSYIDTEQGPPE